jgi:hypothetical protein
MVKILREMNTMPVTKQPESTESAIRQSTGGAGASENIEPVAIETFRRGIRPDKNHMDH